MDRGRFFGPLRFGSFSDGFPVMFMVFLSVKIVFEFAADLIDALIHRYLELPLLTAQHHRLAFKTAYHVKRLLRFAAKRHFQNVFRYTRFYGLA